MDSIDTEAVKVPSLSTAIELTNDLSTAQDISAKESKPTENADTTRFKCIVIGDPLVGKTSLIYSFINDSTVSKDVNRLPGVMRIQEKKITVDNKEYTLVIQDTDYHKINRELVYPTCDLIILCYSVADVISLQNVEKRWIPELKQFAVDKPLILIGCKSDMREIVNFYIETVGEFDGVHMSVAINSRAWFECSAKTSSNINRVFEEIPISIERHRYFKEQQLKVVAQPKASNSAGSLPRQVGFFGYVGPLLKQSYQNLVACWRNPGAFVEKKKAISYYIPPLKYYIPYEEEMSTAREIASSLSSSSFNLIEKPQPKPSKNEDSSSNKKVEKN